MRAMSVILVAAATLSMAITAAQAQVCLTVAEETDSLAPAERSAVLSLVSASFKQANTGVVPSPCARQFSVSTVKLGTAYIAHLRGPGASARGKAASIEELDAVYDQLVRRVTQGESQGVTRQNVTAAQAEPKRVEADGLWFINVGGGYTAGSDGDGVPVTFGFGYRYELDHLGVEAGLRGTSSGGNGEGGSRNSSLRVLALYHFDPIASASSYVGGGLGFGVTTLSSARPDGENSDYGDYGDYSRTGSGLEGHLIAGYSFLRASSIRMFVQGDAVLPFYSVDQGGWGYASADVDSTWAPTFSFSMGVAW